ncbi:MAG: GNAT family N-acetyltransferase [Saprospiraceae bacterium]|nr:GNAT family N-acetyltransferase [Saprospiraceae bacterium]
MPHAHFQLPLSNELVELRALQVGDFEALYEVASDPLIWEQHPNPNRYQRPVFENFFEGALASQGAYLVLDKTTGAVAGSTRFYDFDEQLSRVFSGYTFIGRNFWGKGLNPSMKNLMLQHAFELVPEVYFHVGENNRRSQIAMERLGAIALRKVEVAYHGEPSRINIEYLIKKEG